MIEIRKNGEPFTIASGACLADLVDGDGKGVAIAHNGEVVPRSRWASTTIAPGDDIEIVEAVQGG